MLSSETTRIQRGAGDRADDGACGGVRAKRSVIWPGTTVYLASAVSAVLYFSQFVVSDPALQPDRVLAMPEFVVCVFAGGLAKKSAGQRRAMGKFSTDPQRDSGWLGTISKVKNNGEV